MKKYRCLCCGYKTMESRGEFDICPVCFWEDDVYLDFSNDTITNLYSDKEPRLEELLDIRSGANHGLTLREGIENYKAYGACEKDMLEYVRPPKVEEI